MSMLDGFLGYNQVLVAEEDRLKTTSKHHGRHMHTFECLLH
jgi:hypothetical protein